MASIPGPKGEIRFERDALGYPRISAADREEAAYAQGWLHAEDRMVQVHLQLTLGRGRLMQHAGERPLFRLLDRAFRRLDLERDAQTEAAAASPRTLGILNAYCQGWNARLKTRKRPWLLRLLGIQPIQLTPATILFLHRIVSYLGLASTQQRAEELVAELSVAGVAPQVYRMLLGDGAEGLDPARLKGVRLDGNASLLGKAIGAGSSAWVAGPGRTATGSALLACDFHLEIGKMPPYLYLSHVQFPDGDYLQGVTLPGAPTFLTGRNKDLAWGATYAYGDSIDFVVESCENGRYRRADGQWKPLTQRTEQVKIRGKKPERWDYSENDYGTIEGDARAAGEYLCLRWHGGRGCGRESIDAVLGIEALRTAEAGALLYRTARTQSLHYVLADRQGHIAYTQTGGIDVRPEGWSGAYPFSAWDLPSKVPAAVTTENKPLVVDPPEGLIVSANERVDGPAGEQLATLPHPGYRAIRLRQILGKPKLSLRDFARAQYDQADLGAVHLMKVWAPLLPPDPALDALLAWTATQALDPGDSISAQPPGSQSLALFHCLHRELTRALLAPLVGPQQAVHFVEGSELFLLFQHHLDNILSLQEPSVLDQAALRQLLAQAWPAAKQRAARTGGTEIPLKAAFKNAFFEGKLPGFLGLDTPKMEIPGSPHAAFQARIVRLEGTELLYGPVFHLLFDLAQDGGWYNFAGGASEQKSGPGYAAGIEAWRTGKFHPLGDPAGLPPDL